MASVKTFGFKTTGNEVASHFKDHIAGKTILVTGIAEGGLGAEAALSIATSAPALLILSARSVARAQPVADKITSAHPSVSVKVLAMDLGSLASIRAAVKEFESWNIVLDVLINNAAVMAAPYSTTVDGFETQFGVGHLGHFLFTTLLLNGGRIKDGGRIVNVSSDGHRFAPIQEDVGFEKGAKYDEWEGYGQVKTANLLYSISLAEKLKTRNITSFSLHPGVIMGTNLGRYLNDDVLANLNEQDKKKNPDHPGFELKSAQEGVSTHLVAAFDPALASSNGAYLDHCQVRPPLKSWAADPIAAEKLFKLSEELVGEKLKV